MASFKFRLQPVLEHKRRLEELAQIEHARAQAAQHREELALSQLNDAETDAVAELERQRFIGRLDIETLQLGMGYLEVLKTQIQRQVQVVERVQRQTETKRDQLIGFMQEKKALEKLRQRQLDAFIVEQNRVEAREMDEMVVMRHARVQASLQRAQPASTAIATQTGS